MKTFKTVVVSRHPVERLWMVIRDELPALSRSLADIEGVTVVLREEPAAGHVRIVNEWCAKSPLPVSLEPGQKTDRFVWLDHAEWVDASRRCDWRIQPRFLSGDIRCSGATVYEPAMGGRGSKITFEGTLDIDDRAMARTGALLARTLTPIVESVVTHVIPSNFRKVVEAAGQHIAATG